MSDTVFEILKIVISLVALLISAYLIPWLKQKIGAGKLQQLEKWAEYAVLAAEQVMWKQKGSDKKAYVVSFLQKILAENNITITDEQLDVLIESAVKSLKLEQNTVTIKTEVDNGNNTTAK